MIKKTPIRSRTNSPASTVEGKRNTPELLSASIQKDRSIQVCVRVRPLNARELEMQGHDVSAWKFEDDQIIQNFATAEGSSHSKQSAFKFDHLFHPESETEEIYHKAVKGVVLNTMEGYHGSVLAYGQTSTGKTYTMQGSDGKPGIIELAVQECFSYVAASSGDREFLFRVSYLEIYNEQMNDLLCPASTNVRIVTDKKDGVLVMGVKSEVVISPQQVYGLISSGEAQRHVGATDANITSSRSHTIFRMTIESRQRNVANGTKARSRVSTLSLVDLAGSESAKLSNTKGERQMEGAFINRSLLTLGHIIYKLTEELKINRGDGVGDPSQRHLPYRDSKLTRLLQPSLGGNAQIAIICTISPALANMEETKNTLKFASRAKKMKNVAKINEVMDQETLLRRYRMEISKLRIQLKEAQEAAKRNNPNGVNNINNGDSVLTGVSGTEFDFDEDLELTADAEDEAERQLQNAIIHLERLILKSKVQNSNTPSSSGSPQAAIRTTVDFTNASNGSVLFADTDSIEGTPGGNTINSRSVARELDFSGHRSTGVESKYEMGLELQRVHTQLSVFLERKQRKKNYKICADQLIDQVGQDGKFVPKSSNEALLHDAISRQDFAECLEMLEDLNDKNKALETENQNLKGEVTRLSKILESRESELMFLKGINADEEVF